MEIEKAFRRFLIKEPFYGLFCLSLPKKINKNIDTLCVSRKGINCELNINPDFWETLTDDEQIAVLKHEMSHICLQHMFMCESFPDAKIFNMAADAEVNSYIDNLPSGALTAEILGFPKGKGTKYYYSQLKAQSQGNQSQSMSQASDNQSQNTPDSSSSSYGAAENDNKEETTTKEGSSSEDKENNESDDNKDDGNSENGSSKSSVGENEKEDDDTEGSDNSESSDNKESESPGQKQYGNNKFKPIDSHEKWKDFDNISSAEKQLIENQVKSILRNTAEQCSKMRGTIPSELQEEIDKLNKKKPEVFNWKNYFRRMLGSIYDINIKTTRRRASKRFEGAAGIKHKKKVSILVAIDTSGSVNNEELKDFFSEIFYIWKAGARVTIVECDSEIHKIYEYEGKPITEITGRGGTDFNPPVDYYIKNRKEYASLVYFTDGECPLPKNTPSGMVWIITSNGCHQDYPGKVVYIPDNNDLND